MRMIIFLLCIICMIPLTQAKARSQPNEILSLNFQEVPIRLAFNWLAQYADKNIVLSPKIKGKLNISLRKVRWQQALDIILQSHKLTQKNIEGLFYITPLDKKDMKQSEPLQTLWVQLNYAKASDVAKLLKTQKKGLFSVHGHLSVDKRTNSIFIRDTVNQLPEIKKLIEKLDIPIPQVLIEARIVNVDDDCEKELGIKFGIMNGHHISGSLQGANERASGKLPTQVELKNRLNVDLPVLSSNVGRFGIALLNLGQNTLLDLELSALEQEGRAEIISTPRLLTANQQTASIEAGEEIPYQESVSQGVTTTSFKKAVLRLQVTPQITPGHKIILNLKVNQDKRSNKEILGVPAIDTRQISTQVLVDDGQTLVLGGIYEHTQTQSTESIPFLSDLPLIGVLFNRKKIVNNRRELLIFVTLKIV